MLHHCSIDLKQALKRTNNNISRQEESNNDMGLRQNKNTNQEDSPMFSMNGARTEMLKNTMVKNNNLGRRTLTMTRRIICIR
jgi:hypothetical protein